jgi:cytochrome c-type biogenesis protein CcmH/NrfG
MSHLNKQKPWATNFEVDAMNLSHQGPAKRTRLLGRILLASILVLVSGCSQQPHTGPTAAAPITSDSTNSTEEIAALETQVQQTPNNAELHYKLGLAYIVHAEKNKSSRSRELAIKNFRTVLKLVPGNIATLKLLYNIYYEDIVAGNEKAFTKASDLFNQLPSEIQTEVNAPSLGVFLHRYMAQKKSDKQNLPELYNALLAAMREQPASDKAYIQLAKMYREESYYPLALATLKLGAEQINDSQGLYEAIATTYEARAEASGCSYEKSAYIDDAIQFYQQAVPLAPGNAELHYALARLYLDQNRHQLALHESSILMDLEPTAENIAFSAQNYSMLGKEQNAYTLLEQAKTKGLASSNAAYHEIYMNSGDWMKAALSFTDYLQAQENINVYDLIKADIIGQHADMDFSKLTPQKKLVFNSEWEAAVYAYWINKMTGDQLKQAANNRCERTEYFFYAGYRDYRAGKNVAAKANFSAVLQQNTYRFIERPLARHFLTGLGAK